MSHITACPICAARLLIPVVRRTQVPAHQNLVLDDQVAAQSVTRGNLAFVVCPECGFGFNQDFNLAKLSYDVRYDNAQTYSAFFRDHLTVLVQSLIRDKGVQNCSVVEVGCGNGSFLRQLIEHEDAANIGYGFDPAYVGPDSDLDGRLQFYRRFYDSTCADIHADVVICRHVIEHVPDPLSLLATIRRALRDSPRARVFIETPCLEWILRNRVIWDLFYEHCSIFTLASLSTALETSGFKVENRHHVFEGQYLWVEASVADKPPTIHKDPGLIPVLAQEFIVAEDWLEHEWAVKVQVAATTGKVALWGAGAKGVTLANLIDPQRRWIDCVVDLNPNKQGRYLPGTGHPIVSHRALISRAVTTIFIMNSNYRNEIYKLLSADHIKAALI